MTSNRQSISYKRTGSIKLLASGVILLVLTFLPLSSHAQVGLIDSKYLTIKPGIDDRSHVEKLLGKGDANRHIDDFPTQDGSVTIMYSYGDCSVQGGEWSMPEWRVEEVHYSIGDHILPLRKVILNLTEFKQKSDGHVTTHVTYFNDQFGLSIVFDKKLGTVTDIKLKPTRKQRKQFACRTR